MKCTIQTITPVHIGNGKEYGAADYYITKSSKGSLILARADINKIFASISQDQKEEFIQHLSDPSFQLEDYLKNVLGKIPPKIKIYLARLMSERPPNVDETIKTTSKPYIPGSSIKGALRTAILYNVISKGDMDQIYNLIRDGNRGSYINFWDAQKFQNQFFAGNKNDPKYSIMKFLQVSDTETIPNPTIYSMVSLKVGQGRNEWYSRNGRTVITYAETIGVGRKLNFDLNSNYNPRVHQELGLSDKENFLDIEKIKEFLFKFSRDYIDHEINFAQKYGVDYLEKFYLDLEKINTKDSPLMRIGFGSGFLSTTIGLRLKEEDSPTYEKVRQTFRKSYRFEFPKTRKITLLNKKPGKPLGWVKVINNE